MDTVAFITVELGDDLIVSFAVQKPDDPSWIESLTLLRTPKYEPYRDRDERGVSVSFERFLDDNDQEMLKAVSFFERDAIIELRTTSRHYRLSVRKVNPEELADMREAFHKMNFDNSFRLNRSYP
ncbi:hypothetical protein FHP25_40415 [Vineibacter terrae]|uniref:Uncharacterized protein n=1 Tax=Vineibacter terrae TaxID=2586908 RepID=A0A5C8P629_9HYPH|nr:hypothetical protein [Vineibacter terrae]TXL69045.1 hypothetical protein FHP25_40415 [Vineibacter terrae]